MPKKYKPGHNPASHNNKPKLNVAACEITLTSEQWAIASQLGEGNKSLGVRRLIEMWEFREKELKEKQEW